MDQAFRFATWLAAWLTVALLVWIAGTIGYEAAPGFKEFGLRFLTTRQWDPNAHSFGILPQIWGTVYSSALALLLATGLGLAVAILLGEHLLAQSIRDLMRRLGFGTSGPASWLPDKCESLLNTLVELLAAIPSVVYGLWGIFVLIPLLRPACNWLNSHFGSVPFFSTPLSGPGLLPAVLVLAIMIVPTITAVSRDALFGVPRSLREGAYAVGARRWETILGMTLPAAAQGIIGAVVLGLGRALGETMALAMLVGNANTVKLSLFSPANTLAALLANTFPEAGRDQVPVLMYAALVLMGITLAVNVLGTLVLQRAGVVGKEPS